MTCAPKSPSSDRRVRHRGEPTGAALSALWCHGKDNVIPETVATIEAASTDAGR